VFGNYLPYRTWDPRPIVGTSGLVATSWHPAQEQWGGTQLNTRFEKEAKRHMRPLDFNAWLAVRAVGEAAIRTKSGEAAKLREYMLGDQFGLAAFKGQNVSFRSWNNQLRTPIILSELKVPVSVSPQQGFLHQRAEVDTLGIDEPETKCDFD
jgi:ABC transporter substrate binding protein (PQQ-dependent alcohol dehydrogenase system)